MEKQRDIKVLTIIALIIAILCLLFSIWTISTINIEKDEPNYPPGIPIITTKRTTSNSKVTKATTTTTTTTKSTTTRNTTKQYIKQESIWSVRFENLSKPILYGSTEIKKDFDLKNNSTVIDGLEVIFSNPKDYVIYTFDVINDGNIDSKISSVVKSLPICSSNVGSKEDEKYVCDNIKYTLKYTEDGKEVGKDDMLNAKEKRNLTLKIEYVADELPDFSVNINNMSITLIYIQK